MKCMTKALDSLFQFFLSGPTSTEVARMKAPSSIRAQFGTDCTRNACHGSDSHESARMVTDYIDYDVKSSIASIPCSPGLLIKINCLLLYLIN